MGVVLVPGLAGGAGLALGGAGEGLATALHVLLDSTADGTSAHGSSGRDDNGREASGSCGDRSCVLGRVRGGSCNSLLGRDRGGCGNSRCGNSGGRRCSHSGSRVGSVAIGGGAVAPNGRARGLVVDRDGVVDAQLNAILVASVDTRDLDSGVRLSGRAARDLDLSARNVELGTTERRSAVKTDVLDTEKVLASGGLVREGEGDLVKLVSLEGKTVVAGLVGTHLVDLEPVTGTVVLGSITGGLGHVDVERARVLDRSVDSETDSVTRSDLVSGGLSTSVKTTNVANKVLGGDIGDGRVHVAVLANVLVLLGNLVTNNELVEAVVGHCGLGQGGGSHDSGERAHLDGAFDVYTARVFVEEKKVVKRVTFLVVCKERWTTSDLKLKRMNEA